MPDADSLNGASTSIGLLFNVLLQQPAKRLLLRFCQPESCAGILDEHAQTGIGSLLPGAFHDRGIAQAHR
jgi:hypothetical protein